MSKFNRDIKRFADKAKGNANEASRKIALDLFSSIIESTPVDTGRAKGNWRTSTGAPEYEAIERLDPTGQQAKQEVTLTVDGLEGDWSAFMTNNLPYAEPLERGWSNQAPAGMVRINVARFDGIAAKVAHEVRR